nr:WW domain-binding protein 11-like [Aegilops tauschii subsp. strangulata]
MLETYQSPERPNSPVPVSSGSSDDEEDSEETEDDDLKEVSPSLQSELLCNLADDDDTDEPSAVDSPRSTRVLTRPGSTPRTPRGLGLPATGADAALPVMVPQSDILAPHGASATSGPAEEHPASTPAFFHLTPPDRSPPPDTSSLHLTPVNRALTRHLLRAPLPRTRRGPLGPRPAPTARNRAEPAPSPPGASPPPGSPPPVRAPPPCAAPPCGRGPAAALHLRRPAPPAVGARRGRPAPRPACRPTPELSPEEPRAVPDLLHRPAPLAGLPLAGELAGALGGAGSGKMDEIHPSPHPNAPAPPRFPPSRTAPSSFLRGMLILLYCDLCGD